MKLVRCRNGYIGLKNNRCGHFSAVLTDSQVAALKSDPEHGPIFRCSRCPTGQEWFRVVDNGKGPEIEVVDRPIELFQELQYTEERVFNQVG